MNGIRQKSYKDFYITLTEWFRQSDRRIRMLAIADRSITAFLFGLYPVFLIWLLLRPDRNGLFWCTLLPAVSFLAVSVLRAVISFPRPYEKYDIHPLVPKETKGKSFPSRHVFCAFLIGMTCLKYSVPLAVLVFVLGTLLAGLRVIEGVHFPWDVAAGAILGILCGLWY